MPHTQQVISDRGAPDRWWRSARAAVPRPGATSALAFSLAALTTVAACSKAPARGEDDAGTPAGTGGTTGGGTGGTAGGSGGAPPPAPACTVGASMMGNVTSPSPLVSVGKMVMASAGVTNMAAVVDGKYAHNGAIIPAASLPGWIAIRVSDGTTPAPTRLLLSWSDTGYVNYNYPMVGYLSSDQVGSPSGYKIETSPDSTNGTDGTWNTPMTMVGGQLAPAVITNNPVRNRAHSFAFAGMKWVRMTVTTAFMKPDGDGGMKPVDIALDEIALHDISSAGATGRPDDSWFFLGDSITAGGFQRNRPVNFDTAITAAHPKFTPIILNGGIGGEFSSNGVTHIDMDKWLDLNPDFEHIAILYGTNDEWGGKSPTSVSGYAGASTMFPSFAAAMPHIIQTILDSGRVPIVARIPYASATKDNHTTIPAFNAMVDMLSTTDMLPCGPDFYGWFYAHPDELSDDGVHPSGQGYASLNRLWSEAVAGMYPPN